MRRIVASVVLAGLVACSSADAPSGAHRVAARPGATTAPKRRDPDASSSGRAGEHGRADRRSRAARGGANERAGDANDAGSGFRSPRPKEEETPADDENALAAPADEDGGADRRRAPAPSRAVPTPLPGRYTYAQSGWEEFCAGACRRDDLPPSGVAEVSVEDAGERTLRVRSETRSSDERSMTTTSYVSAESATIAKVELRYSSFSEAFRPEPPITMLRFPLRVGAAWQSSWRGDTSGRLEAKVVARKALVVDGEEVRTYVLDSTTTLRGEFRGTMTARVWVDPRRTTPIQTRGKTRIATAYGRFNSNFATMLIEGPGY